MILRLQKYNLSISYKKGKEMYIADFISRAALPQRPISCDTPEYEIFRIKEEQKWSREIADINAAEFLNVTDQRLQQMLRYTQQDETLQVLKTTTLSGWPDTKEEVPIIIEYWQHRDEITIQNGVLYKGPRVIIPKVMRPETVARVHASHLGVESSLRKARDVLFWPRMNDEIRDAVSKCSTCNEYQQAHCKEPLMTHDISSRPWSKLAMDLRHCKGKDYLVMVDFYSDYWEIDQLENTTAQT
ncbi:uncharacterized protein [Ptychodera flava]|uniref:uncharacterized protein n=1 Tax=Ptychodera flava TaxID=63121 RepID=UPI00396A7B59